MTEALGSIETVGYVVAIAAADAVVKSANVTLLGAENAKGGGLVTIKFVGDVGAVKAAVAAGIAAAERIGRVAACSVIPRPATDVGERIRLVDLGVYKPKAKNTWAPTPPAPPAAAPEPVAPTAPEVTPEPAAPEPLAAEPVVAAPEPVAVVEVEPEPVAAPVEAPIAPEPAAPVEPEIVEIPVVEPAAVEAAEPAVEAVEADAGVEDEEPAPVPPPSGGEPPKPSAPAPHGARKRRGRR